MNNLSISKKIWLGISTLVIGLVVFIGATYFVGTHISTELMNV